MLEAIRRPFAVYFNAQVYDCSDRSLVPVISVLKSNLIHRCYTKPNDFYIYRYLLWPEHVSGAWAERERSGNRGGAGVMWFQNLGLTMSCDRDPILTDCPGLPGLWGSEHWPLLSPPLGVTEWSGNRSGAGLNQVSGNGAVSGPVRPIEICVSGEWKFRRARSAHMLWLHFGLNLLTELAWIPVSSSSTTDYLFSPIFALKTFWVLTGSHGLLYRDCFSNRPKLFFGDEERACCARLSQVTVSA